MLFVLLSVGVIDALIPVLVVIVLIGAAAGLTRGFGFLDLFGVGTLMGLGGRSGGRGSFQRSTYGRADTRIMNKGVPLPQTTKAVAPVTGGVRNAAGGAGGAAQVRGSPGAATIVGAGAAAGAAGVAASGAANVRQGGWQWSVKFGKADDVKSGKAKEYLADKSTLKSLKGKELLKDVGKEVGKGHFVATEMMRVAPTKVGASGLTLAKMAVAQKKYAQTIWRHVYPNQVQKAKLREMYRAGFMHDEKTLARVKSARRRMRLAKMGALYTRRVLKPNVRFTSLAKGAAASFTPFTSRRPLRDIDSATLERIHSVSGETMKEHPGRASRAGFRYFTVTNEKGKKVEKAVFDPSIAARKIATKLKLRSGP